MTRFATMLVGRYAVDQFPGGVPLEVFALFQDSERFHLYGRKDYPDERQVVCYRLFDVSTLKDFEQAEFICYIASVRALRDRLDMLGYTRHETIKIFEMRQKEGAAAWRKQVRQSGLITPGIEDDPIYEETFDHWVATRRAASPASRGGDVVVWEASPSWPSMLWSDDHVIEELMWIIRALLEACDDDDVAVLNVAEQIWAGDYEIDDALCERAWNLLARKVNDKRIVILTEGSTDQQILKSSLEVLYPHLVGYVSFFDYADSNAQGGAPTLFSLVKSFAGAGISNRIVALFDNDSAASDVLRGLSRTKLPSNIKVIQYPPLELATNYPTLGPSGLISMDVNGLAGSIELYLGREVLEDAGGSLVPVQWRGYIQALHRYQGELTNKSEIQRRFGLKVRRASEDREFLRAADWTGLRSIFDSLRTAFE